MPQFSPSAALLTFDFVLNLDFVFLLFLSVYLLLSIYLSAIAPFFDEWQRAFSLIAIMRDAKSINVIKFYRLLHIWVFFCGAPSHSVTGTRLRAIKNAHRPSTWSVCREFWMAQGARIENATCDMGSFLLSSCEFFIFWEVKFCINSQIPCNFVD